MMEKLRELWNSSGRWFLLGLPLEALAICIAVWYVTTV